VMGGQELWVFGCNAPSTGKSSNSSSSSNCVAGFCSVEGFEGFVVSEGVGFVVVVVLLDGGCDEPDMFPDGRVCGGSVRRSRRKEGLASSGLVACFRSSERIWKFRCKRYVLVPVFT